MEHEAIVYRGEVTAMLFTIADMSVNIERILELLEGEIGGEEGLSEKNS